MKDISMKKSVAAKQASYGKGGLVYGKEDATMMLKAGMEGRKSYKNKKK